MKPPFRLAEGRISAETISALEELLAQARSGQLIGIAFAGMWRERQYFADAAGECRRNPTFTRGMIQALDDRLSHLIGQPLI